MNISFFPLKILAHLLTVPTYINKAQGCETPLMYTHTAKDYSEVIYHLKVRYRCEKLLDEDHTTEQVVVVGCIHQQRPAVTVW